MNTRNATLILSLLPCLALAACGESVDETEDPIEAGSQRRTIVEVPCDRSDDGCMEPLAVDSAKSRDEDVIDVVDFGEGFVLVEGVGDGEAKVIAKGDGGRVRITYRVASDAAGSDELHVDAVELELLQPE